MYRSRNDRMMIKRGLREYNRLHGTRNGKRANQKNRFRKKDAYDCGNATCHCCHNDKFPKRTKHCHEQRADISTREQLNGSGSD